MPCGRNSYQTLNLGMNLCSWCPERHDKAIRDHKKSGQIAMSRHTINNSHMYCPQQIRATSACFGLTQGDLGSECNNTPFLSSLSFLFFFFFPIVLRLTCLYVVIGTTVYLCRRSLFSMILLYHQLLWRTGDIVKKTPITLSVSSVNSWQTR